MAYQARLGRSYYLTDGYRTYQQQEEAHRRKPDKALPPGSSQHEKGRAADLEPHDFSDADLRLFELARTNSKEPYHVELGASWTDGGAFEAMGVSLRNSSMSAQP